METEQAILERLISEPGARSALRDLVRGQEVSLSSQAHQALFDWLLKEDGEGGDGQRREQLRQRFEQEMPGYGGLLPYFQVPYGRPRPPSPSPRPLPFREQLALVLEASVAKRALMEANEWQRRIRTFALPSEQQASPPGGSRSGPDVDDNRPLSTGRPVGGLTRANVYTKRVNDRLYERANESNRTSLR